MPLFANAWLDDPIRGPKGKLINFKGFAVGDGFPACVPQPGKPIDWCVDLNNVEFFKYPNALPGPWWDVEFFHGHSQMSEDLYTRIVVLGGCSEAELKGYHAPSPLSAQCLALLEEMSREVGFFYAYNLYEACPEDVPGQAAARGARARHAAAPTRGSASFMARRRMLAGSTGQRERLPPAHVTGLAAASVSATGAATSFTPLTPSPGDGDTGLGAPCLGSAMNTYFGLNVTKVGLGIPLDNNFIVLDNGIGFN